MDFQLLSNKLLKDLDEIKIQNDDILERACQSIEKCSNLLSTFKKEILNNGFNTIKDEITFFKKTKQILLIELIYFSEIHSFETHFPKADKDYQLKFIKKKVNKLNRFFLYNIDFGRYVDSGSVHFDKEYYTRDNSDTFRIITSKFYFQDPEFCTPRDMLLGKYKAYDSLIMYLDEKKQKILKGINYKLQDAKSIEKIHWPFSNTDYVEMLYALYAKGLGTKDDHSIMKVSKTMQEIFDFTPKDIYKTYQYIKNRKNSKTLFLDELANNLLSEMKKSEE
ncbi:RteC domain-containing protein [Mariniflexile sp. AS56]|uniref:RteC domain-containing protein n=1 Tax=Mariniflexile sp. AS56 TaxID=3063957 RepID=UPI0026EA1F05|nr:RteC domain-containing protein [Mariniflexile sp. AS56]MDO7172567.1 RteC domain-containing protein [Mariniflexile sp. AS56]